MKASLACLCLTAVLLGCPASPNPAEDALTRVAVIHGGNGPWAVAGYRMGQFALKELDVQRGSLDLMVTHHSPGMVQYACVADGAAAATGASAGKLNLLVENATVEELRTTFFHRRTKKEVTLRPSAAFVARFKDVPYEKLNTVGAQVLTLPDADVFDVLP